MNLCFFVSMPIFFLRIKCPYSKFNIKYSSSRRSIGICSFYVHPLVAFVFTCIALMMLSSPWNWLALKLDIYPSVTLWICLKTSFQCLCFLSHHKVIIHLSTVFLFRNSICGNRLLCYS